MTREQLEKLEAAMAAEVERRKGLGGYSTDAESLLLLGDVTLRLIRHQIEEAKRKK